jgi:hypothetical protein
MSARKADSDDRAKTAGRDPTAVALAVRRGLFQPSTLWWLACSLLVMVFLPYVPWLVPDLSGQPEYRIGWDRLDVTPPPPGVPENVIESIKSAADLPNEFSLLERGLAERLSRAFATHPWVENVVRVEILRQRRIEITLTYRRPVMLVETSRGYYPVDSKSVLLPPDDFTAEAVEQFPIVRKVKSVPQGLPGEWWGDEVVLCAAKLADALAPSGDMQRHWKRLGLAAIVAPAPKNAGPQPEDLSFELVTSGGTVVVWGRAPGVECAEPDTDEKLARLEQVLKTRGSLDGPGGPYRIDIRHDVISMQSLADRRDR